MGTADRLAPVDLIGVAGEPVDVAVDGLAAASQQEFAQIGRGAIAGGGGRNRRAKTGGSEPLAGDGYATSRAVEQQPPGNRVDPRPDRQPGNTPSGQVRDGHRSRVI